MSPLLTQIAQSWHRAGEVRGKCGYTTVIPAFIDSLAQENPMR